MRRHLLVLVLTFASLVFGVIVAGTADAAPSRTYVVSRTFGPYNSAAKPGDPGAVPDNGEARNVSCNAGDSGLSGSAKVVRRTTHGTTRSDVITLDVVGWYWNSEVDLLQYGAFVGATGKPGWNSVTITVTCRHRT